MKTTFNYLLIACVAITLSVGNIFGQAPLTKSSTAARFDYGDKSSNSSNNVSLAVPTASEKALNAFSKSFPDATDARWSRVEKRFVVDFIKDKKSHKNLYTAKGNLIYSLCYGSEKDLPRDIRKIVKREYIDYNITQAVEANEDSRNVWLINLDDDNNFITVAVENGSIGELSRFTKSKN